MLAISVVDVQKCWLGGEDDLTAIQQRLEEAVGRFQDAGIACSGQVRRVVNRSVSFGLVLAAAEFRPTLVVIGADGDSGWDVPLRDRPSLTVLRKAGCPVLVAP